MRVLRLTAKRQAGRAVRKISEATGGPASTLARLVHDNEEAGRRVQEHQDALLMIRGNLACKAVHRWDQFEFGRQVNPQNAAKAESLLRINELRNIARNLSVPPERHCREVALHPRRSLAVPSRDSLAERAVRRGCPLQVRFMCSQLSGETCLSRSSGMLRRAAASGLWRD